MEKVLPICAAMFLILGLSLAKDGRYVRCVSKNRAPEPVYALVPKVFEPLDIKRNR